MTDEYQVVYTPAAKDDIKRIYSYIAFDLLAEQAAREQIDRIRNQIRSLDKMPRRFPEVDWEPWKSMSMRQMFVDNYTVFYLVDSECQTVTVDRVLYSGRDMKEIIGTSDILLSSREK